MAADSPGATTTTDRRRQRAEESRHAIREAVIDLLSTEHPASLSIPAVAARAGVSTRTVYRHFPTKQDLLDDVSELYLRRAESIVSGRGDLFDDPARYLTALWADFEQNLDSVRAHHTSPLGDQLRFARRDRLQDGVARRLEAAFAEASPTDRADLGDLIMTVAGSATFLELHTRFGHSGPDAARLAWWAVTAMQQRFAADGGIHLDHDDRGGMEDGETDDE